MQLKTDLHVGPKPFSFVNKRKQLKRKRKCVYCLRLKITPFAPTLPTDERVEVDACLIEVNKTFTQTQEKYIYVCMRSLTLL